MAQASCPRAAFRSRCCSVLPAITPGATSSWCNTPATWPGQRQGFRAKSFLPWEASSSDRKREVAAAQPGLLLFSATIFKQPPYSAVIVRLDRTIQYSETSVFELRSHGVLDARRSLSSGGASRRPGGGHDDRETCARLLATGIRPSFASRSPSRAEGAGKTG